MVAGEPGDGGAAGGLHDGECGAGALDLAGRRRQQLPGGDRLQAEHGGDGAGGEPVAYGKFERFALLRGGAGGFGPGEGGELPSAGLGGRGLGGGGGGGVLRGEVRALVAFRSGRLARHGG
ncbi:hypothetical protein LUR56_33815 [Streptomyces sp. MT29]|nr:hypothetical protein [Streptomyces sp. MT29]